MFGFVDLANYLFEEGPASLPASLFLCRLHDVRPATKTRQPPFTELVPLTPHPLLMLRLAGQRQCDDVFAIVKASSDTSLHYNGVGEPTHIGSISVSGLLTNLDRLKENNACSSGELDHLENCNRRYPMSLACDKTPHIHTTHILSFSIRRI